MKFDVEVSARLMFAAFGAEKDILADTVALRVAVGGDYHLFDLAYMLDNIEDGLALDANAREEALRRVQGALDRARERQKERT